MSNETESLSKLIMILCNPKEGSYDELMKCKRSITFALEQKERLEQFYKLAVSKHVNFWLVSIYEYVSPYNYFRDEDEKLTDEEFKFLKEMYEDATR